MPRTFASVIAALVVTLILLFAGEGATRAQSLGEMMQNCEPLETHWRQYPPTHDGALVPDQAKAAICYGYMQAFTQLQGLMAGDCSKGPGPNCYRALRTCIPVGVLFNQILAVFLAYARSHVAQWHEQAWSHYAVALATAFPCKSE